MSIINASSNTLIEINQALLAAIKSRLDPNNDSVVDIRFDMPDVNTTQANATLSIFLYDVHEDLQMRQTESGRYHAASGKMQPRTIHLNCNYLITYWPPQENSTDGQGPDSQPDNQAVQVITLVMQSLLNNRELPDMPGAYTRIIPPQENLNSLGNFWQSLGNRPRLSLACSITAPFKLDDSPTIAIVKHINNSIVQASSVENRVLSDLLKTQLAVELGGDKEVQQNLARFYINVKKTMHEAESEEMSFALKLTGFAPGSLKKKIDETLNNWKSGGILLPEININPLFITDVDDIDLAWLDIL
ncbi:DUF4255 domain-containing protein [Erwinia oleae]|uniref:DUF4255 domain-containing protein n=1 Tax=Erwinia oleae TaxID=796334 RepID=UPI0005513E57|nr:DUF4255 domain-containing protein [Erwinia oleae]